MATFGVQGSVFFVVFFTFFDLNCCTISCNISSKKKIIFLSRLGEGKVANSETSESSRQPAAKGVTLRAKGDLEQEYLPNHKRIW